MLRESGLLIPVPTAEALVGDIRQRHDPMATLGVPAHVTLVVPFIEPARTGPALESELRELFARQPAFSFQLASTGRFPGFLYLNPAPAEPFRRLVRLLGARYPAFPPYDGKFDKYIPHLTVASSPDEDLLDELAAQLAPSLPLTVVADHISLVHSDIESGSWRCSASFDLGGAVPTPPAP